MKKIEKTDVCDGDCFHCPYPDCIASVKHIYRLNREEQKRNAEKPVKNVSSKLTPDSDIADALRNTISPHFRFK